MPVVGRLYKTGVGMESVVEEVRVAGGELVLARRGSDTLWSRGSMTLSGTVRDSTSGAAVATARVALRGTRFEVVTDVAGRFAISGVLPGEYMVEVRTPSLDSVSAVHQAPLRFVEKDAAIRLRVPDARLIAASVCGRDSVATAHDGIVIGMVSYRGDTLPAARSTVAAEWDEFFTGGDSPRQRRRWLDGVTGAQGMFRLCGLPRDTKLTLRAATDSASAEPVELRIPPTTRFARADLVLDREQAAHAVFSGVVLVDSTRQPLPDVTISLSAISRSTATNEQGAFRLRDIPAGTHLVEARRLGYAPATMQLAFAPNQTVHQQILLGRVPVLDTVAVRARPVIASFEEHRTIGLGRFFTSDTLRKMESRRLSDILAPLPGTDIMKGIGNHAWLTLNRGVRSRMPKTMELDKGDLAFGAKPEKCYAQVYLDGSLVYRGREREPLFDLSSISVASIEAIEYYTGAAQTPLKYSGLDSQCGVLVIHTRRAP